MIIKIEKPKDNLLILVYKTNYDMLTATYRFSHYHEYKNWRNKYFTEKDLDKYYKKKYKDKDWWKRQWAGANLRDTDISPFINLKHYGPIRASENDIVKLVTTLNPPYAVCLVTEEAPECLEHEMAHALYYINQKYRDRVTILIEKYWDELLQARLFLVKMYEEEQLVDELHAYCGIFYEYYFKQFNIPVPKKLTKQLISLYNSYK